jgi:hypothetical protein
MTDRELLEHIAREVAQLAQKVDALQNDQRLMYNEMRNHRDRLAIVERDSVMPPNGVGE